MSLPPKGVGRLGTSQQRQASGSADAHWLKAAALGERLFRTRMCGPALPSTHFQGSWARRAGRRASRERSSLVTTKGHRIVTFHSAAQNSRLCSGRGLKIPGPLPSQACHRSGIWGCDNVGPASGLQDIHYREVCPGPPSAHPPQVSLIETDTGARAFTKHPMSRSLVLTYE